MSSSDDRSARPRSPESLASESTIPVEAFRDRDWLARVVTHVLRGLDAAPTLDDAARVAGYETTYFSKKFHAAVGRSYSRWLIDVRARRAAQLLRAGDRSVLDVALAVGYTGTRSLERICRSRFGLTPTELREGRKPPRRADR